MNGTVFIEELRRGWRGMLGWGIGMGLLMMFAAAIIQDNAVLDQYRLVLEAFPPEVMSAFGISNLDVLTTAEGFIAFAGFTYGALILSVYGVLNGLNITANDEDEGSLNVLLSMPLPRWRIVVEKYMASSVMLGAVLLIMFGGIALGALAFGLTLNLGVMLMGTFNLMPLSLAVMAITSLVASFISRKSVVSGLAATIVVASYFINVMAGAINIETAPVMGIIQKLSVFSYVDSEGVVVSASLNPSNIAVLLGISLLFMVVSVYAFERRDIGG